MVKAKAHHIPVFSASKQMKVQGKLNGYNIDIVTAKKISYSLFSASKQMKVREKAIEN